MLPTINGKSILDCNSEDLQELIGNSLYRESEYIDYKSVFTIDYAPKGKERDAAIAELRSDVCSFANADGGYLIYGVQEDGEGIPKELVGIDISNKDRFELSLKDKLQAISPRIPAYSLSFIPLENEKHIVVLFIMHDYFAPYVHLEGEKDYRIYKRIGNSKKSIMYSELKNMFLQSMVLEKEIEQFRLERVESFRLKAAEAGDKSSPFLLLHIIPETFLDTNYNHSWFVLERIDRALSDIFYSFGCHRYSQPIVEGLLYSSYNDKQECRLYDNGIAECFYELGPDLDYMQKCFQAPLYPWRDTWGKIEKQLQDYIRTMQPYMKRKRIFVAISVINCKDIPSYAASWENMRKGVIDRDKILCQPTVLEDISDEDKVNVDIMRTKLQYLLSLGVMNDDEINPLIKEIYGENEDIIKGALQ